MKSWSLKIQKSQELVDCVLIGPPFLLHIGQKSKSKIRKLLYLIILTWLIKTISLWNTDREIINLSIIFFIILIPALIISQQQVIIISGNHENWTFSRRIITKFIHLQIWTFEVREFEIQFNIIMNYKVKTSAIIFHLLDSNEKLKIITHVKFAKEFKDNCDVVGLKYDVRRRGKEFNE